VITKGLLRGYFTKEQVKTTAWLSHVGLWTNNASILFEKQTNHGCRSRGKGGHTRNRRSGPQYGTYSDTTNVKQTNKHQVHAVVYSAWFFVLLLSCRLTASTDLSNHGNAEGQESTMDKKWLHQWRRAQPIGIDTDQHDRAGKSNCNAAPPSRSAVCHYWVQSICGTQHRLRALLAATCLSSPTAAAYYICDPSWPCLQLNLNCICES